MVWYSVTYGRNVYYNGLYSQTYYTKIIDVYPVVWIQRATNDYFLVRWEIIGDDQVKMIEADRAEKERQIRVAREQELQAEVDKAVKKKEKKENKIKKEKK